mmetsp:Transcript_1022/g.1939  ORF Transcript_1022/g.1939 Transcript_1022/m.1939 type:complete len:160 (-) Transcript_1022:1764-2243(-)
MKHGIHKKRGRPSSKQNSEQEKTFHCTWKGCDDKFSRKYTLEQHYRRHTGEKPYACKFPGCGTSFRQLSNLQQHVRYHTGERPYECEFCHQRFYQMGNLRQHVKKHESEQTLAMNSIEGQENSDENVNIQHVCHERHDGNGECEQNNDALTLSYPSEFP